MLVSFKRRKIRSKIVHIGDGFRVLRGGGPRDVPGRWQRGICSAEYGARLKQRRDGIKMFCKSDVK